MICNIVLTFHHIFSRIFLVYWEKTSISCKCHFIAYSLHFPPVLVLLTCCWNFRGVWESIIPIKKLILNFVFKILGWGSKHPWWAWPVVVVPCSSFLFIICFDMSFYTKIKFTRCQELWTYMKKINLNCFNVF